MAIRALQLMPKKRASTALDDNGDPKRAEIQVGKF